MFRILLIVLFGTAIGCGNAKGQATVTGAVLDLDGKPLPTSQVEAFPVRSSGFVGNIGWTKVDDRGNFSLILSEGRYQIRAKDEPEGYPDPNALLSIDPRARFPEIMVLKQDISGLTVRLGVRGGILEGDVRDKTSGALLQEAKITISDAARPEAFVEVFCDKTAHFQFTVPSKSLLIAVSVHGYKGTQYADGKPVLLSGGERRAIDLELERQ